MRWRDTVYLCQRDTEDQKQMKANETERQRTMGSWGYKFEQYMMSEGPKKEPKGMYTVYSNAVDMEFRPCVNELTHGQ